MFCFAGEGCPCFEFVLVPDPVQEATLLFNYTVFKRDCVEGTRVSPKLQMQSLKKKKKKTITQRIRKRKGILRGQKDRSSSRDPPTGKSHRAGSTSQHGFSKQCSLPSTHTPGAEFQVLNLDNTDGILAVLLHHTWDFRQLSVKNICKDYSLHFSHDKNENEYLQSRASQVAQWSGTHLSVQGMQVPSLCGEDPWEEGMASHSSILA